MIYKYYIIFNLEKKPIVLRGELDVWERYWVRSESIAWWWLGEENPNTEELPHPESAYNCDSDAGWNA
jgi:hypothetical protein